MRILVTGGCGFIGSNFIRYILQHYKPAFVTNVDVLTYAGNLANLNGVVEEHGERYEFFKADIANADQMDALMTEHRFYAVINFAAESHVDRSINDPLNFIHTNVIGTSVLLDCARRFQDLRPGGAGDAVLEQLRPVSIPGKINSAHDY